MRAHGIRFFSGELTDAYLSRGGVQRGLSHVYYRGGHVVEPTELSAPEAMRFWLELLHAGRAIERVFGPVKMNYDILGNSVPHLHVHLVPRYADDPRPDVCVVQDTIGEGGREPLHVLGVRYTKYEVVDAQAFIREAKAQRLIDGSGRAARTERAHRFPFSQHHRDPAHQDRVVLA